MRGYWWMLCLAALYAGSLRAQSSSPDYRYVMRAQAEYLAGYPYVPRNSKGDPKHVRGMLYAGFDSLHFRFCSENPDDIQDPMVKGVAIAVDNSLCENTCGPKVCRDVRIPYPHMKLLARGRVVGMGGTSEDIQVASAGLAIAGLIGGISTGGVAQKGLIGATVAAAGIGFGIHEYELKRANFMSIFFTPSDQADPSLPCGVAHQVANPPAQAPLPGPDSKAPKPPDASPPKPINLFAEANGCNVALFQLFNSHQYWDLSMILNSRTGKEFIAQNAELK
jgi:hypothetical protein